jgi:uncharacterized membrane protein
VRRAIFYTLLVGLVGAAIVHIAVLLLVPRFSERDAWSRIAAMAGPFEMVRLDGAEWESNPFLRVLACRFEIEPGIARVRAEGKVPFWSAAIFDRSGRNIYSLNDRTTIGDRLDLVIATPVRMIELRKDLPEELAEAIFVELDNNQGLAVIRVVVPDSSWNQLAERFLAGARCHAVAAGE